MALPKKLWSLAKTLIWIAALGATFLLFAFAGMRISLKSLEVTVPDLMGKPLDEGKTATEDLGLRIRIDTSRRLHPTIPAGAIMLQDPKAGVATRRQRTIKVWVSAGASPSQLPSLIGETEGTAQLRLREDKVELLRIARMRSNRYPNGAVVAQDPPPAATSSAVSVLINQGERTSTYVMSDLIGAEVDAATAALRSQGFRVTVTSDHSYPNIPPGIVLRQYPQAGFQISLGEPISLEVSR